MTGSSCEVEPSPTQLAFHRCAAVVRTRTLTQTIDDQGIKIESDTSSKITISSPKINSPIGPLNEICTCKVAATPMDVEQRSDQCDD